jgi:MFS family permease
LLQEKGKTQLRLLATSHSVNHVYQLLPPVVLPEITREYGFFNAELLLWSFVLSYSLLPAVSGYLSRFFSRRKLLTAGFVLTSLSFLAIGLTSNVAVLALLFFTAGVGGSTYHPFGSPILAETYPTNRGRTLGLHQTGGAIGSFVGPFITGVLVVAFGWRPATMILAVPGLLLAAKLYFSISPKNESNLVTTDGNDRVVNLNWKTYTPAIVFIVAAFIYVLGLRGTDAFANEYFAIGRGIEIAEASLLFSMLKVAGLFSAPVCGTLSPNLLIAIPCIVFGFASFGLLAVGEALLADVTPEKQRPTIFGINNTASFSPSVFLVPLLFGLAPSYGFSSGFILLSALMPLSIPIILMIRNKPSQQR